MQSTLGIRTKLTIVVGLLLVVGVTALGLAGTGFNAVRVPAADAAPGATHQLFMPMLFNAIPGISGRVTMNGTPAPGIAVLLRLSQSSTTTTIMTATTAADGTFLFAPLAALTSGQRYSVRVNGMDVTQLTFWQTPSITKYGTGNAVVYNTFDIANVPLQSPIAKAVVPLPVTFMWNVRTGVPTDNYQLFLTDSVTGATFTTPALGYVGTYTLTSLPPGFNSGDLMRWSIKITAPDQGFGQSEESRTITIQ